MNRLISVCLTLACAIFAALAPIGCETARPSAPVVSFDLEADADRVWAAVVEAAEAMDLMIARADPEARVITTEWQTYSAHLKYGACAGVLPDARLEMRHTIRVVPGDAGATLAFDSRFRMIRNTGAGPLTDCASSGAFEQRFMERTQRALR